MPLDAPHWGSFSRLEARQPKKLVSRPTRSEFGSSFKFNDCPAALYIHVDPKKRPVCLFTFEHGLNVIKLKLKIKNNNKIK
jgi:hypothetical protein